MNVRLKIGAGGGTFFGVPVADKQRAKENRRDEWWLLSDTKPMVSALFEESGEIAPVDLGQFGKRAGEIIARATRLPRRRPQLERLSIARRPRNLRSSPRGAPRDTRVAGTPLRGPRRLWIPSISAFTRVFDALCAGMSGRCVDCAKAPRSRRQRPNGQPAPSTPAHPPRCAAS